VGAPDHKVNVFLSLFRQVSNAESANVILAARRNKDSVEVHQADGAAVLVHLLLRSISRVIFPEEYILLRQLRLDAHLVSLANVQQLIYVLNRDLRVLTPKLALHSYSVHDFLLVHLVDAVVAESIPKHELLTGLRMHDFSMVLYAKTGRDLSEKVRNVLVGLVGITLVHPM